MDPGHGPPVESRALGTFRGTRPCRPVARHPCRNPAGAPMDSSRRRTAWSFALMLALAAVMLPSVSRAQTPSTEKTDPVYLNTREIAELKRSLMMEGEQRKIAAAAAEARKAAKSKNVR